MITLNLKSDRMSKQAHINVVVVTVVVNEHVKVQTTAYQNIKLKELGKKKTQDRSIYVTNS